MISFLLAPRCSLRGPSAFRLQGIRIINTFFALTISLGLSATLYAQNGALSWVKRAGSQSIDEANGVAVDSHGNVYVTGYFKLTATFGQGEANETVLTALNQDLFLAKYAASGNLIWVRQAKGFIWGNAIGVDPVGNVYVFGHYASQTAFNPGQPDEIMMPAVGQNLFLAKFNSDGKCLWARQDGGNRNEYGNALALGADGSCYVTGRYGSNPITFGAGEVNETVLPGLEGDNGEDIFIAQYNTDGMLLWAQVAGGAGSNNGAGIGVDSFGFCYVTGRFSGVTTFFSSNAQSQDTLEGTNEIFVAMYAGGELIWVRGGRGQAERDEGTAIAVDANGNSYTTGTYRSRAPFLGQLNAKQLTLGGEDDIFIAKHDINGELQWVRMAVGPGSQYSLGIAIDESGGGVFITGYGSALTFGAEEEGEVSLGGVGAQDVFVAKYDSDGRAQWAKLAGGSSDDRGQGVAFAAGSVFVVGRFGQTATFGSGEANQTAIVSRGNFDIFTAKFRSALAEFQPLRIVGLEFLPNGNPQLRISGSTSTAYSIRRTGSLEPSSWNEIGSIITDDQGRGKLEDTSASVDFPVFYQATGN